MLKRIEHPELFFGLVAPIGVDLSETVKHLEEALKAFEYKVIPIKVTELFRKIKYCDVKLEDKPSERRFKSYINFGNRLRELTGDKAICASLVVDKIAREREIDERNGSTKHREKYAYVIHQFKRKEEIELLRSVYGKLFFQISVYSSKGERSDTFAQRISRDHRSTDLEKYKAQADELIKLDEDQEENDFGQRVRDVFHLADFIINKDIPITQRDQLDRFVELIFGKNTLSPTKIEYGMYMARAAALRSLDLSRQVGAAIFSPHHEVITLGCNEVPKGGGGTYWCDDGVDARDYKWETDPNDEKKKSLVLDLFERMQKDDLIDNECLENFDDIIQTKSFKDAQLMDIIEFGRIVHAEMSALMDAARLGRAVQDAKLFCTTFPCHICAKHITAAGIHSVYFLEPYPKSAAFVLHPDSIEVEGSSRVHFAEYKKTQFIHFHGISPRRYRDFFEKSRRKDKNGRAEEWLDNKKRPILDVKLPIYLPLEGYAQKALKLSIKKARKILKEKQKLRTSRRNNKPFRRR